MYLITEVLLREISYFCCEVLSFVQPEEKPLVEVLVHGGVLF